MKRRPLRISPCRAAFGGILCLILGAITTVAVAWAFAVFVTLDLRESGRSIKFDHFTDWFGETPFSGYTSSRWSVTGVTRVSVHRSTTFSGQPGRTTIAFEDIIPNWAFDFIDVPELRGRQREGPYEFHTALVDARGWPFLSMWGGVRRSHGGTQIKPYCVLPLEPLLSARGYADFRWLPLLPIWPGFLIDTLFYGAIWFGVFFGFSCAKRFLRAKRGRCPRCGYDLRGQRLVISDQRLAASGERSAVSATGCPECGWAREET